MKPFEKLVPRIEAIKLINENINPINRVENIPLIEGIGRVLAEDVIADFNVPPFDRSSMDGYAVKAGDTIDANESKPVKLKQIGIYYAGENKKILVENGQCIEISTGSPIPNGANAVVMVEYTKKIGDFIEIYRKAKQGDNIAPEGEDIKKNEVVLKVGEFLTPGKLGALAALGKTTLRVFEKPLIGIYSTGTEIVEPGVLLKNSQIYDINSYTINAIVESNGCVPIKKGIILDEETILTNSVLETKNFDLTVFSGGSSVGSKDLLSNIVENYGKIHFHGLQVKPGKPTLFGEIENRPIFGMPGYPTSCLNNSYVFLIPALRKLAHLPLKEDRIVKARLAKTIRSDGGREQFFTVKLNGDTAMPVFKQSGDITSIANADGYFVIPIGVYSVEEDTEVEVILFNH